jgi:hypothetical protein
MQTKVKYGLAAGVVAVVVAGNFHFVNGSLLGGFKVMPKVSWSLSETFVNSDQVGNLPGFMARSQYPLFLAALERKQSENGLPRLTAKNKQLLYVGQSRADIEAIIGPSSNTFNSFEGRSSSSYYNGLTGDSVTITYLNDVATEIRK